MPHTASVSLMNQAWPSLYFIMKQTTKHELFLKLDKDIKKMILFMYLLKAYSPANRTGHLRAFSPANRTGHPRAFSPVNRTGHPRAFSPANRTGHLRAYSPANRTGHLRAFHQEEKGSDNCSLASSQPLGKYKGDPSEEEDR